MDIKVKGLSFKSSFLKRFFDIIFSIVGLIICFPIILFSWIIASIDTQSNGFFTQERVGKGGKLFKIIKIKSMNSVSNYHTCITTSEDIRVTRSGSFFRKSKIDELPQLINVLFGQMSFVGPRPDVPGYADRLEGDDQIILSVRPGIVGPATLKYRNEEIILSKQSNFQKYNDDVMWLDKIKLNKEYIKNYNFFKDLYYIWRTIYK